MKRALALWLLFASACSGAQPAQKPTASAPRTAPASAPPSPIASPSPSPVAIQPPGPLHFNVSALATGLEVPWSLAFIPGDRVLVTERPGRVRVIEAGQLLPTPALTLGTVSVPGQESGVLGIAADPHFPNPPDVYVYYTRLAGGVKVDRISRFRMDADSLVAEQVILDNIPAGQLYHYGGRIRFGPDGKLYATVGEGFIAGRAADRNSLDGKILRLNPDGSVPEGNPFGTLVYAWGFRNPEGLDWDPSGHLFVTDNGPSGEFGLCCHDEVDHVVAGGFYGWPIRAGNAPAGSPGNYPPLPPPVGPIAESGAGTWAPSGLSFYTPRKNEQPTLLVATLRGQMLLRFVIDAANADHVAGEETVLTGYGRLRDAEPGPDGCLYVLTSNRDGRGTPRAVDDELLKLCPA